MLKVTRAKRDLITFTHDGLHQRNDGLEIINVAEPSIKLGSVHAGCDVEPRANFVGKKSIQNLTSDVEIGTSMIVFL